MRIFISYPWWFILFCALIALLYTSMLYFRQKDLKLVSKSLSILLSFLRFVSSFLIAFLLLSPFIKQHHVNTQKPIVVIAEDNSQSINYAFIKVDSSKYFYDMGLLIQQLSKNYEVKRYSFDEGLHASYSKTLKGQTSNISKTLDDINGIYFNQNLGAIILATDGIYNRGVNPLYSESSNLYPIYTVVLGDTTPRKDAKIERVLCNDIVYLGDQFELIVNLGSYHCNPSNAVITIEEIGAKGLNSLIDKRSISYTQTQEQQSVPFNLNAKQPGFHHYRITHSAIKDEFTLANNRSDIYVQVIDSRDKILLLADGPHPDLSAIKQALSKKTNYSVDIKYVDDKSIKVEDYNIVVLYQVPNLSSKAAELIQTLTLKNISTWFILGTNSYLQDIPSIEKIVEVKKIKYSYNDVHAAKNDGFSVFTLNENVSNTIEKLPPLTVPFGEYTGALSNVLLMQKIGSVTTSYPLWAMGEALNQKQAILLGEGIWRWRMYNYMLNQNNDAVDELIQKTIQYLSVKSDKRKFRTLLSKVMYGENENVIVNAQLYNDNYQLINSCDVSLDLMDENKHQFSYTFSKKNNLYELDLGKLASGIYSYKAHTRGLNKEYSDEGKFTVKALFLESLQTKADDELLYAISKKKEAQMVYAKDLLQLVNFIENKSDLKPILYDNFTTDNLINLKLLFVLILILIGAEWIVRKYLGLY